VWIAVGEGDTVIVGLGSGVEVLAAMAVGVEVAAGRQPANPKRTSSSPITMGGEYLTGKGLFLSIFWLIIERWAHKRNGWLLNEVAVSVKYECVSIWLGLTLANGSYRLSASCTFYRSLG